MTKKILILSITGTQGTGLVNQIQGKGYEISGFTRNPDSEKAKEFTKSGIKIFKGDFDDYESLVTALKGQEVVFVNLFPSFAKKGQDIIQNNNVFNAIKEVGTVKQIIVATVQKAGDPITEPHNFEGEGSKRYWEGKRHLEKLARESGLIYTIARPSGFYQNVTAPNVTWLAPDLPTKGLWKTAVLPTTKLGQVDGADTGKLAAAAIADPEKFNGKEVTLLAELRTIPEIIEKLEKKLGQKITFENWTQEEIESNKASHLTEVQLWQNKYPATEIGQEAIDLGITYTTFDEWLEKTPKLW